MTKKAAETITQYQEEYCGLKKKKPPYSNIDTSEQPKQKKAGQDEEDAARLKGPTEYQHVYGLATGTLDGSGPGSTFQASRANIMASTTYRASYQRKGLRLTQPELPHIIERQPYCHYQVFPMGRQPYGTGCRAWAPTTTTWSY